MAATAGSQPAPGHAVARVGQRRVEEISPGSLLVSLGAVGNERKANTLELIFLTRLTARRILTGKWLALVAQTVLLVCAVLPYAVLRYFLGSVDLGAELTAIALLLLGSAVLSGVAVGFSPQS